ncbi:MAG: flagellar protein export ATPase FliI [Clostridiales bacterium]|nr:flagellar protein export ATPase FliI [Clostridiales bacterium]
MLSKIPFDRFEKAIDDKKLYKVVGKVTQIIGLTIQVEGIQSFIGEVCEIVIGDHTKVLSEVVGFRDDISLLMPLGELTGIGPGSLVYPLGHSLKIKVGKELLGKVVDGLGRPLSGEEYDLEETVSIYQKPPNPMTRRPIENVMSTGIRSIDGMLTCGEGQRLGIFAGSGVGKSTLLGKISRLSDADVNVIALIGERNRELLNVIHKDLGEEGLKKSVVLVATSDQPALIRSKGAFVATAIAEYFRDQGLKVMFMMDSVTRFAMAEREIGLAIGEPPTSKGYTPSVFARLPKLLERSGTSDKGSITAFYTVLVEGDDMNEPIADAVRGILDGHIVLSRKLASKNHFPAIDVQNSISRLMKQIVSDDHYNAAGKMRDALAVYEEAEDLINVGAYVKGSNPKIDKSILVHDSIIKFLQQGSEELSTFTETTTIMENIF